MFGIHAGYGEEIITSSLGAELTGYGYYLERKAEEVADDLKVRAIYIRREREAVILISCDLLSLSLEFTDNMRWELSIRYNLPICNILLACIHTHAGPAAHDLPGLGEMDQAYSARVGKAIIKASEAAQKDCRMAEISYIHEMVTPVGYNRKNGSFAPIDPILKTSIFTRQDGQKIYLVSYACHPVVLGQANTISADWPGALIAEIERDGHRGIFLQGFCGDVNPVSRRRGMGGTAEDLQLYGEILYRHIKTAQRRAIAVRTPEIKAVEGRIRLPLAVPPYEEIVRQKENLPEYLKKVPLYDRFIDNWIERVKERYEEIRREPFLPNVPIQLVILGEVRILGLPGEVFSAYSLKLSERFRLPLMTVGYSGGNIGYLPTADAYDNAADYACYQAPKFYGLFPFDRELETVLLEECDRIFACLDGGRNEQR
ncbi:MAG: hypothetical protein WC074_08975 [bacterium]